MGIISQFSYKMEEKFNIKNVLSDLNTEANSLEEEKYAIMKPQEMLKIAIEDAITKNLSFTNSQDKDTWAQNKSQLSLTLKEIFSKKGAEDIANAITTGRNNDDLLAALDYLWAISSGSESHGSDPFIHFCGIMASIIESYAVQPISEEDKEKYTQKLNELSNYKVDVLKLIPENCIPNIISLMQKIEKDFPEHLWKLENIITKFAEKYSSFDLYIKTENKTIHDTALASTEDLIEAIRKIDDTSLINKVAKNLNQFVSDISYRPDLGDIFIELYNLKKSRVANKIIDGLMTKLNTVSIIARSLLDNSPDFALILTRFPRLFESIINSTNKENLSFLQACVQKINPDQLHQLLSFVTTDGRRLFQSSKILKNPEIFEKVFDKLSTRQKLDLMNFRKGKEMNYPINITKDPKVISILAQNGSIIPKKILVANDAGVYRIDNSSSLPLVEKNRSLLELIRSSDSNAIKQLLESKVSSISERIERLLKSNNFSDKAAKQSLTSTLSSVKSLEVAILSPKEMLNSQDRKLGNSIHVAITDLRGKQSCEMIKFSYRMAPILVFILPKKAP